MDVLEEIMFLTNIYFFFLVFVTFQGDYSFSQKQEKKYTKSRLKTLFSKTQDIAFTYPI